MMMMTTDLEYGVLPKPLLRFYREYGVSVTQHERLLDLFGDDWNAILSFVKGRVDSEGTFRMSKFL